MKKVISIFLIILILFNTMGFYGIFLGLRFKAKNEMVNCLNEDRYDEDETITLKLPLSIPYNTDDESYERVDGSFQHQGEFYRLVKQKLAKDTLYIVCIKDEKTKNIKKALSEYVKTFTDKPVDAKSHNKAPVSFIKDFLPSTISVTHVSDGWNRCVDLHTLATSFLVQVTPSVLGPPPKA